MPNWSYEFDLLHEEVALEDQFPDKTHEKAASVLSQLIKSSNRGITIGLEGGWGSGKSTVVNFLRKQLVPHNEILFFLFDAWAHKGDPLRRIFLESLIDEIKPVEDKDDLSNLKQMISGRQKKVVVTAKKSTSRLGKFLSISAIFIPTGAALLSATDYSEIPMSWTFYIGFLLALSPVWVLIGWWLCGDRDKDTGKKQWDVFAADSTENYTQDITEDGERTSIEFEHYFEQIMKCTIGEDKRFKKALIVVDNLDRVEPEHALAIWSILQTFFQHRSRQEDDSGNNWRSKLWFLIPYDREGLSKVWDRSNSQSDTAESLQESTANAVNLSYEKELASSFLEKCFQIVAEVPEPVMSAWADYCEGNAKKALIGWPEHEVSKVIEIFKLFESRIDSSPSPRQILAFINRVGFLGLRWGGEMCAEAIALYALMRKDCSERQMREKLLYGELPNWYEGKAHISELKIQLSGMLFGVEKNKGIQLLLESEIKSALKNGDSERISSLIDVHEEAFWIVWESIKNSSLPHGHTEEYLITATKAFCRGVLGHEERAASGISHLIHEWKDSRRRLVLDKHDYSEALNELLNIVPDSSELLLWLETTVKSFVRKTVPSIRTKKFSPSALSNLSKLIDLLSSYEIKLKPTRYPSIKHTEWKTWKIALDSEGVNITCILPAKGTIEAIAEAINISDPDTESVKLLISTLSDLPTSEEWEKVADMLIEWGNYTHSEPGNNNVYELMLRIYLQCKTSVKDKIKCCIVGSQFIQNTQQEDVNLSFYLLALYAVVLENELLSSGLAGNVCTYWQSRFDQDRCGPVIETLRKFDVLWVIWRLATDPQNQIAIDVVKNGGIDDVIYVSKHGPLCIGEYNTWASDEELQVIVSKLSKYGGLGNAKPSLVGSPVDFRACLKQIGLYGGEEGKLIVEEALKNVSASQWTKVLSEDRVLFDCLGSQGNHEFKDGFIAFAKKELKEGSISFHVWDSFSEFYKKLMDKKDVAKILATDYFKLIKDPLTDQAFNQFAPVISSFVSQLDPNYLMQRVENWLVNSQWLRISWLLNTGYKLQGAVKQSLVSRVKAMLDEVEEDKKSTLLSLAKAFQIEVNANSNTDDADGEN